MDNDSYKKNLDRVTVDEVVFQFMQQVFLGGDYKPNNGNASAEVFKSNITFMDFIKKIYSTIPPTIGDNLAKCEHTVINVPKGHFVLSYNNSMSDGGQRILVKAYLEKSGIDITEFCTFNGNNGNVNIEFRFKTGFAEDDKIIVFYKKK